MRKASILFFLHAICLFAEAQSVKSYLDSASAAIHNRNWMQASAWCNRVIETDSNHLAAYRLRAQVYQELGYYTLSIEDIDRVIESDPMKAEDHALRGFASYMLSDYRSARFSFRKAQLLDSGEATHAFNLGRCEEALHKWNDAIQHYTRALQLDPGNAEVYQNRGHVYFRKEAFHEAMRDFDSALKYKQNDCLLLLYRGMALTGLKRFKEAIHLFDRCIRLNSNVASAYYNRGMAWFHQRDFKRARNDFDSAIHHKPDMELAYFNRALCKLEISAKSYPSACDDLRKALSLGFMEALDYTRRYCE